MKLDEDSPVKGPRGRRRCVTVQNTWQTASHPEPHSCPAVKCHSAACPTGQHGPLSKARDPAGGALASDPRAIHQSVLSGAQYHVH